MKIPIFPGKYHQKYTLGDSSQVPSNQPTNKRKQKQWFSLESSLATFDMAELFGLQSQLKKLRSKCISHMQHISVKPGISSIMDSRQHCFLLEKNRRSTFSLLGFCWRFFWRENVESLHRLELDRIHGLHRQGLETWGFWGHSWD